MSAPSAAAALLAGFVIAAACRAQATPETPAEPTIPNLLRDLERADASARPGLVAALLARGEEGALRLLDAARRECTERTAALQRAAPKHAAALQKAATAAIKKQLRGAAAEAVETLRKRARTIVFGDGLTKDVVHTDLDPILAELEQRTLISTEALFAQQADLKRRDEELHRDHADLCEWYRIWIDAMHAADATPTGKRRVDAAKQVDEPPPIDRLLDLPSRIALLLAAASPRDAKTLAQNEELVGSVDAEELEGIRRLTTIRLALGLGVLQFDTKLGDAARGHSKDMAERNFFSHESPVPGKRTFGDRAALAGTSASAENIAAGQDSGVGAVTAWWYSPGHLRNMLGGHGRVGLGRSGRLWTQMFGG